MSFVKVRDFARFGAGGELDTLYCKLCGTVIGQKQERTIGYRKNPNGQMVERVVESFARNHLYMEIKIAFEDGSAHVTNGCTNCLTGPLAGDKLEELATVDELDLGLQPLGRKGPEVVETKKGGGIV